MDCFIHVGRHPPHAKLHRDHPSPLKKMQLPSTGAPHFDKEQILLKSARSSIFQQYYADCQLHQLTVSMLKSSENGRPSVQRSSSSSSSSLSTSTSTQLSSPPSSSPSPTMTAMAKTMLVSEEQEAALSHLLSSKSLIEFIARVPSWADTQKESGMPQRQQRAFYSHQDWLHHRSSLRHIRHLLSSGSSRVILSLIPPVFTVTAISVVIAAYNTAVNLSVLPPIFPLLHAASLPYELTAPAIALMLVFRTDASYSRYDEARRTWNKVLSTTEDFVRLSLQFIQNPQDRDLQVSLLAYIMAFPVSLKCHLTYGADERKDLQHLLGEDDLKFVLESQHRPHCLIQLMSQTLCLLKLDYTEKEQLDESISQFIASISICERLIRTPIPLSYTRLTSRFLVLWHLTLPIILWDSCDWLVVPATFFNAATLFCIEEVGVIIEEPFPMLALDKMIGLVQENIWDMLRSHQRAKDYVCNKRTTKDRSVSFWRG
ncbi:hypothetical protein GOP47_0005310 [Adiantum capillus-veneris]|uniref:Uncharacterized protein n=1 Tax=Adiantum capillus-veneris TaxID=13818 RepID=A0A9D4V4V4_ADICA|nr:hypothetical protein GOP47_0005310 [Adiantum capillus-veneris]